MIRYYIWSPESCWRLVWRRWVPGRNRTRLSHPPGQGHTEGTGRFHPLTGWQGQRGCLIEVQDWRYKSVDCSRKKCDAFLPIADERGLRHQGDFAVSCALHLPENPLHLHLGQKTVLCNITIECEHKCIPASEVLPSWPCPWGSTDGCSKPPSWEDVWTGPCFHGQAASSASTNIQYIHIHVDLYWKIIDEMTTF